VAAGKIWMYPAWTESEQRWAIANHAPYLIVGTQYGAVAHRAASIKASIAGLLT